MNNLRTILGLLIFVAVCLAAGGLGAIATTPEIEGWYRTLAKPSWTPPDWVFGPVWTMLYILMGISGWLIWKRDGFRGAAVPLGWFAVQLILNLAWSFIFFGAHQLGWALVDIIALWLAIAVTMGLFFQRSKLAGGLLVPYLVWVSYATALNFAIWGMNS